jgi:ketosteroid isomerase-like protein
MEIIIMKKLSIALLIIIICLSIFFSLGGSISRGLSGLVDEEYAFAQTSLNEGIRTAFLTYLSDNAIIFTPDITNGKEWHTNRQPSENILNWKPIFADISVSGELGYTTGPWEFSTGAEPDKPVAFGHYVSIWQKQSDNKWKVIVDMGISHASNETYNLSNISKENILQGSSFDVKSDQNNEEILSSLKKTDVEFVRLSKSEGFKKAAITFAGKDVRLYRDEHLPAVGKVASLELIEEENYSSIWDPHYYGVSKSGDLGYTYGITEYVKPGDKDEQINRSTYLRIWKKEAYGKWQLVLNINNPFPPPNEEKN